MRPSIDKVSIEVNQKTHEFKTIMASNLIVALKEDGSKYTLSDLVIDKRKLEEQTANLQKKVDVLSKGYLQLLEIMKANNINLDILKEEIF